MGSASCRYKHTVCAELNWNHGGVMVPSSGQLKPCCIFWFRFWMATNYSSIRHTGTNTWNTRHQPVWLSSWMRRGPLVSPCEAAVADGSGHFTGHTTRQRLLGEQQLSSLDPGCRPKTVSFSRTDKTLQLRCHHRFSLHVNRSVFTSVIDARAASWRRTCVRTRTGSLFFLNTYLSCLLSAKWFIIIND